MTRINSIGGRLILGGSPLKKTKNKYGAIKTTVEGIRFDSAKEAERYQSLRHLERAKEIDNLERQIPFKIFVNGHLICEYRCDFRYRDLRTGETIVEDVKSTYTAQLPVYRLKKKLMLAVHKIEIQEY